MARVLITGASGLLGSNLAQDWAGNHEIIGTYHENGVNLDGVKMEQVDLTRPDAPSALIEACQPDWIVNCAAATDVDHCQRDPEWARCLNRDMPERVARRAAQQSARLIHISTDLVFDGVAERYDETANPQPVNTYGETKLEGEKAVLEAFPQALVVRTNLFGLAAGDGQRGLLAWFLDRLRRGERTLGFADVYFSPILVNSLGEWLLHLVETGAEGVIHVAGGTCLSKYEFGRLAARAFGLDAELIVRASIEEADLAAPRVKRLCLDSGRAERLVGRPVPSVESGLDHLATAPTFRRRLSSLLMPGGTAP